MNKEIISSGQGFSIVVLFATGSSLIIGVAGQAKNDMWIAVIIGILMAIPFLFAYARILSLFPGMDLYDILQIVMGVWAGKAIALLYIWYAFHLGSMVIRNLGEFVNTVALPETPIFVPMLFLGLLCIWVVNAGIEVLGRTALFLLPLIILILFVVQMLAVPNIQYKFLKPVLGNGWGPVLQGAFSGFSFPFAETVLFTTVFFSIKKKKSLYKVYLYGTLFSGAIILAVTLRNITVLGAILNNLYFPSYLAVSRISVGDFLQRIEVTVSIVFITGVFVKTSVCLFAACNGVKKLFGLKSYRSVVIPIGLLMVYLAYFVYDNIMEMNEWAFDVYPYYVLPFQVILPIVILITAEIRKRSGRLKDIKADQP